MNGIEREKETLEQMVRLYCRDMEGNDDMCEACAELLQYSLTRIERCRFGAKKPTCRKCMVHCYNPAMRARIKIVMRYAGPRMLWHHPWSALLHVWKEL